MTFLFGEKTVTIGDNQSEVAGAGLVHPGKVDFIENAMTQREPDAAVEVEGRADAGLGARSPARLDAGPAGGVTDIIAHKGLSSPFQAVCQKMRFSAGSFTPVSRRPARSI